MSSRFHAKFHGFNHASIAIPGIPDSFHDPIAAHIRPFQGDFVTLGPVSCMSVSTNGGVFSSNGTWALEVLQDAWIHNYLQADSGWFRNLTADDLFVNTYNLSVYEMSGYKIIGNDYNLEIPIPYTPIGGSNLLLLSGVGLSSYTWGSFNGSLYTNLNLYVAGSADIASSYIDNLTASYLTVENQSNLIGNSTFHQNLSVAGVATINDLYVSGTGTFKNLSLSPGCTVIGVTATDQTFQDTSTFLQLNINGNTNRYIALYEIVP